MSRKKEKSSRVKEFLRGYKGDAYTRLSAKSKFLHIAAVMVCIFLVPVLLLSVVFTISDLVNGSDTVSTGSWSSGSTSSIKIIKNDSELGYEFDATLDDFINNWNTVTEELYGKSSLDDVTLNSITYVREEVSGNVTVSVYNFIPPFETHAGVGFYVNKETGNIIQLNYTIDMKHVDNGSDTVRETYFVKNVQRIFGCLGPESEILARYQRAAKSDRSHDYQNNIVTTILTQRVEQTDMYLLQMMPVTNTYYKSIAGE